jgi:hypothetical protein
VAAFFLGRQSDEIFLPLSQLWPSQAPYRLLPQPDGSLLIVTRSKLTGWSGGDRQIYRGSLKPPNQLRILPQPDGNTETKIWVYDPPTGSQTFVTLDLVIKNGRVNATERPTVLPLPKSAIQQSVKK